LKNIKAGFTVYSLFLFNLDRVLRYILKPLANITISRADKAKVGSCLQDGVLPTPITLVLVEGFILL
jgi:hypothetical protein